jgi:hypothetical protein
VTESTDTGFGLVSLSDSEFVLENQTKDFRGLSIYDEGGEEIGTVKGLYADSEEGRVLCRLAHRLLRHLHRQDGTRKRRSRRFRAGTRIAR